MSDASLRVYSQVLTGVSGSTLGTLQFHSNGYFYNLAKECFARIYKADREKSIALPNAFREES